MSVEALGAFLAGEEARKRQEDLRHQHQEFTDTTARYMAGEDVTPGDCWRTVIACLTETPRDEVPHFAHLYPGGDLEWWHRTVAWVEERMPGFTLHVYPRPTKGEEWVPVYNAQHVANGAPDRVILTDKSPRGDWNHSVLVWAMTGNLEHDPMPGGDGVVDDGGEIFALIRPDWWAE